MATIKLKKSATGAAPRTEGARPPVRGSGGVKSRPTLAQAQVQRAEREARYQEQLRQRFGDRPPEVFARREPSTPQPARRPTAPMNTPANAPRPPQRAAPRAAPLNTPMAAARPQPLRYEPRPDPRPRVRSSRQRDDEDDERMPAAHAPGSMRLSKRMSELGIASRREADEWIAKGYVRVDDQIVSELGSRVLPQQRITIDAKAKFQQAQRVTVLVNKPVGFVSGQAEDGYEPAVALVTPANQWREDRSGTRFLREHLRSLVPAGRLDIDSVGLLVLTQDGRIAKQLIGEGSEVEKEYLVRIATTDGARLADASLALLRHGLELDGEALRPAQVEWVNADQLRFVLTQGKKRQIRRMCEAVGIQVLGLKRVRIGRVMLGDLPAGQWRYLRADEAFA
jgi:23S rRNA pseudouridine2604 synthase